MQLNEKLRFQEAEKLVTYFQDLGISDLYLSPFFASARNSTHGYDICDHSSLNPVLGGSEGFIRLARKLKDCEIGLIVDFVPNHMSTDPECNAWWRDVLTQGESSFFSHYFDIDWNPLKTELRHKVLLPILGTTYGEALESGELKVDLSGASPCLRYFDINLPLMMSHQEVPKNIYELHHLLEQQQYRLSYWRTALHEINYRRFFDVNSLIGIRVEDPEVFIATHQLLLSFVKQGLVTGIRLDHIDGLFDPGGYLDRLNENTDSTGCYVIAEKILSSGESLTQSWKVEGTTGYDYLNVLNGIFIDSRNAQKIKRNYEKFADVRELFSDVVYQSKKLIIQSSLSSEMNVLASELNRISEMNWRYRDFTLDSLQEAVTEIVACFPVYRTYVSSEGWTEFDENQVGIAIARALRRNPAAEPSIYAFIREMLLPERNTDISVEEYHRRIRFAMKFQQYTGPVQAKGVEDTAFYRYAPLLSLNEVGGDPLRFGRTVDEFHLENQERLSKWPLSMLATSTHDTKRGEDARARINVLSEIPDEFRIRVNQWARINAGKRSIVDGEAAPDRRDEYCFYQALTGAWPVDSSFVPDLNFVERIQGYMSKMTREAKRHTSWINPNQAYDNAISEFVRKTLLDKRFLKTFWPFIEKVARWGVSNSLAQVVLKTASPGVPDFYQGTELWDFSLVDPDNRRAVDYDLRQKFLQEIMPLVERPDSTKVIDLLQNWQDGRIKLYLTACCLHIRRKWPDVFLEGEYLPVAVHGDAREHVVAFVRQVQERRVLAVATRLAATRNVEWGETLIDWSWPGSVLSNVLTGERIQADSSVSVESMLRILPVGLWVEERGMSKNDESK